MSGRAFANARTILLPNLERSVKRKIIMQTTMDNMLTGACPDESDHLLGEKCELETAPGVWVALYDSNQQDTGPTPT